MLNLLKQHGFMPLASLIFLNAFIDLGHKITIQNTIFKLYDGTEQIVLTAIINAFILLPYIFFFRPAGKFADKYAKHIVLRLTSAAAFIIILAISVCYWQGWFWPAFFLTLVLALQSAYYGPAKLGYLKELVSNEALKQANGIVQSLLMVAILSGILVFSALFEARFLDSLQTPTAVIAHMLPLALLLTAIAFIEAALAWRLPKTKIAEITEKSNNSLMRTLNNRDLLPVILGLSVFWSVGQMLLAVYPAFAKETLAINDAMLIQAVLAMIAIGIMFGSLLDSLVSRHFIELRLLPIAGIVIVLIGLCIPFTHSLPLATALFFLMGVAGGLLVVPLNSLMQFCTPPNQLGITIAYANLIQNIAMFSCLALTVLLSFFAFPAWQLLFLIAAISMLGLLAMLKLMPQAFKALASKAPLVKGFNSLKGYGNVFFVTERDNDAAIIRAIQHSYPRDIRSNIINKERALSLAKDTKNTLYYVAIEEGQPIHLAFTPYSPTPD